MPTKHMTVSDALARLSHALVTCSDSCAHDIATILHLGAGQMGLPEGAVCGAPPGLVNDRRKAWLALSEAIRTNHSHLAASWTPIHAGNWESVLATLVIEGDWEKIASTAADLRQQYPFPQLD
jgi:hypothetical protein